MDRKATTESRVNKCKKASIRFLIKARDFYMKSMTQLSAHFAYEAAMESHSPAAQLTVRPRSFSSGSTTSKAKNDFKKLRRAASAGSYGSKIDSGLRKPPATSPMRVPRSQSVGIGRIDEEEPCDFGDDDYKVKEDVQRNRSCSVRRKTKMNNI